MVLGMFGKAHRGLVRQVTTRVQTQELYMFFSDRQLRENGLESILTVLVCVDCQFVYFSSPTGHESSAALPYITYKCSKGLLEWFHPPCFCNRTVATSIWTVGSWGSCWVWKLHYERLQHQRGR